MDFKEAEFTNSFFWGQLPVSFHEVLLCPEFRKNIFLHFFVNFLKRSFHSVNLELIFVCMWGRDPMYVSFIWIIASLTGSFFLPSQPHPQLPPSWWARPPLSHVRFSWMSRNIAGSYSTPQENVFVFVLLLLRKTHWLKPPTLARHHSNHLCELFYNRRSWQGTQN